MEKVFMNRTIMPEETVKKAEDYINNSLGIKYNLDLWNTPDEKFWVSKMQLDGFGKAYPSHATTMGKGLSKYECLASNYGEFFEKLAWEVWKVDAEKNLNKKIKVKNLVTNEYERIEISHIKNNFWGAEFSAAGNNIEEARYHSLLDVIEIGWGGCRNAFMLTPIENTIVKTEEMFPNIPQYYHDNTQILVQRDMRIPSVYFLTAFKAPNENDPPFMKPLSQVVNGEVVFNLPEMPLMAQPMLSNTTNPWPPFLGRRLGLNMEKTVPLAIAEIMQVYYFYNQDPSTPPLDFYFPEKNIKKQNMFKEYDAQDYKDFENPTIESDNQLIINEISKAGFNLWELDITPPESPISVVKIISDYSYGRLTHVHEQTLNKFFDI